MEEDGVVSFHESYDKKYSCLFNMDQTAVFMDNPGRVTVEYRGETNVDIIQGTSVNGGRCSVFLCASATGEKLSPLVVYAGVPEGPISEEVSSPSFGDSSNVHTVQPKAFCDYTMGEWISKVIK